MRSSCAWNPARVPSRPYDAARERRDLHTYTPLRMGNRLTKPAPSWRSQPLVRGVTAAGGPQLALAVRQLARRLSSSLRGKGAPHCCR